MKTKKTNNIEKVLQGIRDWVRALLLLLLFSCKYSFSEDKLSQVATAFNLAKPQSEKAARIVIQCDADTPTGVRSIRGTVMDYDSSAPIQNAFVSTQVSTEVYATDVEGKFKIQKVGLETTRVILKAIADNYKSLSAPIDFSCQNLNVSGSDDKTDFSNLQYRVYVSASDNIRTVGEAEANGEALNSFTKSLTSLEITTMRV